MQENAVKEYISCPPELKEALYHSNQLAVDCKTKFSGVSKFSCYLHLFLAWKAIETIENGVCLKHWLSASDFHARKLKAFSTVHIQLVKFADKLFFNTPLSLQQLKTHSSHSCGLLQALLRDFSPFHGVCENNPQNRFPWAHPDLLFSWCWFHSRCPRMISIICKSQRS